MDMHMVWLENRLKINTQGVPLQAIFLSKEDQKQIWSPKIVIKNNVMSISKEGELFGLWIKEELGSRYGGLLVAWDSYSLSTTMKCEMDSQTFPFDKHVCKIVVN